jgi:hypothetical protein
VTAQALIAIESRSQSRGIRLSHQLSLRGIDECAQSEVGTVVANRFELKGSLEALIEHRQLDVGEPSERIAAAGRPFPDPRVFLCETGEDKHAGQKRELYCITE